MNIDLDLLKLVINKKLRKCFVLMLYKNHYKVKLNKINNNKAKRNKRKNNLLNKS